MKTTKIPNNSCPKCSARIEFATAAPGPGMDPEASPQPGDLTICINCSTFLIFEKDLSLSLMTKELFDSLEEEDKLFLQQLESTVSNLIQSRAEPV